MSRPQKMHKPLKFGFTDIINAVADGNGVATMKTRSAAQPQNIVKATDQTPKKKS
jgi:hypothetical protein